LPVFVTRPMPICTGPASNPSVGVITASAPEVHGDALAYYALS
jgi:hypothetical protein